MIYLNNVIFIKNNYIISNLYLLLIIEILYYLKYYILMINNLNIKNFNIIYFKLIVLLTNIDINSIDTIQNVNSLFKIILNLNINFIYINKKLKINILLFILPLIYDNIIILNGLYKTCIQLFKKNNKIFIIKFKKNNNDIIYIYMYINYLNIKLIFEINNINIYCYYDIYKFNFIILLLYLNYMNIIIKNYNIILKKIIIYNYIKFIIINKKYNIYNIFLLKLFIIKIYNNFYNNKLFINILKIIFSIKINFIYYYNYYINNINNKKYYSIIDHLLIKSKEYIKNFKNKILTITNFNIKLLFNYKKYINIILENININPLIQYSDQVNNLSEINQKFKINMITTGLNSKFILNTDFRELSRNILGYISLINTNEGLTCGLINYLTINVYLNLKYKLITYYKYLFYYKYNFKLILDIFDKNFYNIYFNKIFLKKNLNFNKINILTINKNTFKINNIQKNIFYIPFNYLLSFIENLIPFIHYNDSVRNLMSIKMHTQIIPILYPILSNIITNYNFILNKYLNYLIISYQEGIVIYVSYVKIIIRDIFNRQIIYYLNTYRKFNQNVLLIYKPIVWVGEKINIGKILAINSNLLYCEYSLGNNLLVGYGSYLGYEYEDAIIINKKILYNNLYTSLHLNIYEISCNILNNIPEICSVNLSKICYKHKINLDKYGIIREGSFILANNILVSKLILMPFIFNNKNLINIINFLFGNKLRVFKNKPIISTIYDMGRVIKVEFLFNNLYNKKLKEVNIYLKIRIYIGVQKYLQLGDKICNRHGNKGVISYINEINDMPYLNNKIQPDLFISSISIPSRINVGQILEGVYGLNSLYINNRYIISNNLNKNYYNNYINIFNYYTYNYINNYNINKMSYNYNKYFLKNPFTGHLINNSFCLNSIYYYKLIHMVRDKLRYRFIGLYSELTQQPIKGNTKQGGQRFGEMEVWALEAFGASFLFKEFFTYKSDDIKSRKLLKNYLFNNNKIKTTFISETFKLILKELQSLSINIETFCIFNNNNNLIKNIPINIIY
ncbi:DNA-directed RNA polymerase B subunit (apicoplast) [Plasmodium gonderi]|uniref:DNA-directed RNA polymerase subunit beta n=1 Tax=Plasmodium gonderi TaxID=77519 RepID=A0A1Y1JUI9_PLAGO|nr:DNA-directed RNA polymerase B subunit [Plasmodium gonderi]BBB58270.1 DNA-directed RNA polymerase B subunit [Plasmodium gonderi]GAW84767.1 DNA-directed RNA polymerase B subunit [Plasmodium gonderi]